MFVRRGLATCSSPTVNLLLAKFDDTTDYYKISDKRKVVFHILILKLRRRLSEYLYYTIFFHQFHLALYRTELNRLKIINFSLIAIGCQHCWVDPALQLLLNTRIEAEPFSSCNPLRTFRTIPSEIIA